MNMLIVVRMMIIGLISYLTKGVWHFDVPSNNSFLNSNVGDYDFSITAEKKDGRWYIISSYCSCDCSEWCPHRGFFNQVCDLDEDCTNCNTNNGKGLSNAEFGEIVVDMIKSGKPLFIEKEGGMGLYKWFLMEMIREVNVLLIGEDEASKLFFED